jgi:hypothetical protein
MAAGADGYGVEARGKCAGASAAPAKKADGNGSTATSRQRQ